METPISKSQIRAMKLLKLAIPATYQTAGEALEQAGYRKDAIPVGATWRSASKLTDADLLNAIALPADRFEDWSIDRY